MKKNLKVTLGALAMASVLLVPMAALALEDVSFVTDLNPGTAPVNNSGVTSANALLRILVQLLGYVQALFWIAAVFFGLYAAFLYLTAAGDGEKISRANHMLIYVVVAVVVAVIAYSIPSFVQGTIAP